MSDWITHLGTTYFVARLLSIKDLRLILLGAILPDIPTILIVLGSILDVDAPWILPCFESFHTPFMLFLVITAISLLNVNFKRCFLLIAFGSLLHILLDLFQTEFGGELLLYPFSFKQYSFNLFWTESIIGVSLIVLSTILLVIALFDNRENSSFSAQNLKLIIPLLLILITVSVLTLNKLKENDISYMELNANTEKWEGKKVSLIVDKVTSLDPVIIKKGNNRFEIVTKQDLKEGDWVSLRGTYSEGKIYPEIIHKHIRPLKTWTSAAALLFFILFWFLPPRSAKQKSLK